jgi:Enoyl-CoA hydratase/isomerase
MDECVAALKELGDDQRVRAILVRGEGRAFSAGFNMKAKHDMSTVKHVRRQTERQFDVIMAYWDCPKPRSSDAVNSKTTLRAIRWTLASLIYPGTAFSSPGPMR